MLNIVVAPAEHNIKAQRLAKHIVKYLKNEQVEYSVYFSQDFKDLKNNIKEISSLGETEYIIIGDDTVIHEVISSIKDINRIKIGIIPTSKNDDFAKSLGISCRPQQAIKEILNKKTETVDLLIVNDMPVINNVVVGASVEVHHHMAQYKFKNFIGEKLATLKYGNNFAGIDLALDAKTKTKKELVFELVVANSGFCKGKPVSPLSNLQDGLFNVTYSLITNKTSNKKYIKKFNKGEHIYDENTKQFWMNKLKITNPEKKIKTLIDGKIYNLEELNISIIEKGLKIYKN